MTLLPTLISATCFGASIATAVPLSVVMKASNFCFQLFLIASAFA
jgi:hypothetical protein